MICRFLDAVYLRGQRIQSNFWLRGPGEVIQICQRNLQAYGECVDWFYNFLIGHQLSANRIFVNDINKINNSSILRNSPPKLFLPFTVGTKSAFKCFSEWKSAARQT